MATQAFKKTRQLFHFSLKKERIKLVIWIFAIVISVAVVLISLLEVNSSVAEREAMAVAMQNPAMEALFGRVIGIDNYTIGAMYSHQTTLLMFCLIAILSILLVARNTRAEEEDGILEIFRSLPVGKLAHMTSAIWLLVLVNISIVIGTFLTILPFNDESLTLEGALLTGAIYGTIGLFFGVVTIVTAQLSNSSRGTMMGSFAILGVSYVLRIIGDAESEVLSWISPLGLLYGTEPFVKNNWWPVFIVLGISILFIFIAFILQSRRDLGAGILPDKAGRNEATRTLKTQVGFNWRLIRTTFLIWLIALTTLAISYGSVIGDLDIVVEGNELMEQMITLDAGGSIVQQFTAMLMGLLAILVTIPSVQFFLKLKGEEKKNRSEMMVTGTRSRISIILTFYKMSCILGSVLHIGQVGAFIGAATVTDVELNTREIWQSGLAYLPAIWIMIGIATLLYGWLPKLTGITWIYLFFALVVLYFAGLLEIPESMMTLSPFYHIPEIPMNDWSWLNFISLFALGKLLAVLGFIGYKVRDIEG